jgi:hypothetical protein
MKGNGYKAVIPIVSGIAYVENPIPELVKGSRTPYREYNSDFEGLAPRSRDDALTREIEKRTGVYDFQIRVFRALGSGKHWVGVMYWQNEEFEDYKLRNLVVTLQSGKSWGVAENKVLRWVSDSEMKGSHYDETGAGSIEFLRWVLDQVKWTISGARSVSPMAGRTRKPVRLKVGWGNDKRERAYAWLTRLGFIKVTDAGDGDPAYILDIVEAESNPTHFRRNSGKTYADLMEELRWLGPASVMKLVLNGNTRQCGESAFTVAQYLIERGFTARTDAGAGKYCSHFDLAVHTADRGWVSVDPTYIQFQAPNNESHALDIADRKLDLADDVHRLPVEQQDALVARFFEPTVQWSVAGMLDGTKAFEIAPAQHVLKHASPSEAETPGQFRVGKTWRQHWEWYRGMAQDLTRGDFDEIDTYAPRGRRKSYWVSELSRRLMGKALSGSKMKTNPTDLEGRFIPDRYLAGLPPALQKQRIRELTESRDAYKRGDYSELPTDRAARKMGLVKESSYTTVAKKRGIEWRGDARDMASRVLKYYVGRESDREVEALAEALGASFRKGLAAWKSGGHRPGATAQNWAVARVNSLVVGGKTSWTADKKQFAVLPADVRKKVVQKLPELYSALKSQGRQRDVESIRGKAKANPVVDSELKRKLFEFTNRLRPALLKYGNSLLQKYGSRAGGPEIVDQAVAEAREYIAVKMIQDFSDPLILSYLDYRGGLNELRGVGVQLGREAMRKAIMKAMSVTGAADLEFWNRVGAAKRMLTRPGRAAPTDADVARYFGLTLDEFNTRKFQHRILTELSYEQLVGINRDPAQRGPRLDTADVLQPSAQTERRARALVYAEQEDAGSSYDEPAATAMQFIQEIFPAPDVAAIHRQFRLYEGYGALEGEVVQHVLESLNRDRRMLLGAYAAGDKTLPGLTERQFDVAIKGGYNPGTRTHSEGLLSVIRGEIAAAAEAIASLPEPRIAQIASGEVSVAEGLREAKSARLIAGPTSESDVPELAKLRRKRR